MISKGTTEDKLLWAFTFYDVNHDGVISKEEMIKVRTPARTQCASQRGWQIMIFVCFLVCLSSLIFQERKQIQRPSFVYYKNTEILAVAFQYSAVDEQCISGDNRQTD